MAVETPPWAVSGAGATYTAEQTRRALFPWAQRTGANTPGIVSGGLISATDMTLTAPGSGLSVNVGVGEAIVGGDTGTAGAYYCLNKSTTNLTIATASGSHPRIDTVVAVVADSGYTEPTGFSGNQWTPAVITGTATAGATLANLTGAGVAPADSLTLGYVLVPTSATSIVSGDILNLGTMVMPQSRNLGRATSSSLLASNYTYAVGTGIQLVVAATVTVSQPSAYVHITGGMSGAPATANGQMEIFANVDSTAQSGAGLLGSVYLESTAYHKWVSGSVIMGPYTTGAHTVNLLILPVNESVAVTSGADATLLTAFEMPN
jgi:hypothetical protein